MRYQCAEVCVKLSSTPVRRTYCRDYDTFTPPHPGLLTLNALRLVSASLVVELVGWGKGAIQAHSTIIRAAGDGVLVHQLSTCSSMVRVQAFTWGFKPKSGDRQEAGIAPSCRLLPKLTRRPLVLAGEVVLLHDVVQLVERLAVEPGVQHRLHALLVAHLQFTETRISCLLLIFKTSGTRVL